MSKKKAWPRPVQSLKRMQSEAGALGDRYRQPIWSADGLWSFGLPWITP